MVDSYGMLVEEMNAAATMYFQSHMYIVYIYKLTRRPKIKCILDSKSFRYVSQWNHADRWPLLPGCQEYPPWTLWHLQDPSPPWYHLSTSSSEYSAPSLKYSRVSSSISIKNILLNTHQEYPRPNLLLLQPLPPGSQECPPQNQCPPACPRKCSPP